MITTSPVTYQKYFITGRKGDGGFRSPKETLVISRIPLILSFSLVHLLDPVFIKKRRKQVYTHFERP